jgi:two-component system, OmpR family, alkaline phosphatase synthesis response regulator PhoP
MIPRKIAVVDDDEYVRELVAVNLQKRGYAVITVGDSTQALAIIEANHPDLVILDIMMPNVDGWEILKLIKDNEQFNDMKVLMLTARTSPKDQMIGKEILNADEYMMKPFDIADLLNAVKRLIDENGIQG